MVDAGSAAIVSGGAVVVGVGRFVGVGVAASGCARGAEVAWRSVAVAKAADKGLARRVVPRGEATILGLTAQGFAASACGGVTAASQAVAWAFAEGACCGDAVLVVKAGVNAVPGYAGAV